MKKTYIKPEEKVFIVNTTSMMATSGGIGNGTGKLGDVYTEEDESFARTNVTGSTVGNNTNVWSNEW